MAITRAVRQRARTKTAAKISKARQTLAPMDEVENKILPRPTPIHPFRLGCQTRVEGGPITVTLKPIY